MYRGYANVGLEIILDRVKSVDRNLSVSSGALAFNEYRRYYYSPIETIEEHCKASPEQQKPVESHRWLLRN